MEYHKLFCNEWYKRKLEDQRILFREYLRKEWWKNASEEEIIEWYIKESARKASLDRARLSLALLSTYTEIWRE